MRKLIDFIFFQKRNPNYEKIRKGCIFDAYRISLVACPLIAFIIVLFMVASYILPETYKGEGLMSTFRIYYIVMLVGMMIDEAVILYVGRQFDKRYRILPTINAFIVLLLLWWGMRMSYMDYLSLGHMDATIYMVVLICIPFCQFIDVRVYIIFSIISDLLVVSMFLEDGAKNAFKNANLTDFFVFAGIQLFLGIVVYYYKYNVMERFVIQEEQKEEISRLNDSQNRFFSNMSHEIRTPINTIIGLNEMILREDASEEINEDAQNIQAASHMLLHLINDILDMSKFESGQMELNVTKYRTGDMLSDIVGMLWIRAKEKNLAFHVDVSPELPSELIGDEMRIKQILINVVNNAIKYTSEGYVRLTIQCEKGEDGTARVSYTVSDTGMGIRKESIPHLFTAFKRVDTEKNKYIEGTGLGLSIVKQFVDLMGGKITVNSVYTKGSTFVIEIPQVVASDVPLGELDMEDRHRSGKAYTHVESFEAPEAKILVVDDTSANLMVVTKLLKCTKVQVCTVISGAEALKKTVEQHYDLILMDHKMPGMDGIECMHAIKEQTGGFCRDSRIVALTANTGADVAAMYEKEGFDGYLTKPVTGEELEDMVYRMLPRNLITVFGGGRELAEESKAWIRDHQKKVMVKVTTESVADVPASLRKKYNITVIPHMVRTDDGLFKDELEIETDGLLAYMRNPNVTVQTEAPSEEDHETFFSNQLDDANNILHISISRRVEHSGCHMAMEAAQNFGNVTVVDSGHLSGGQGLMAIEAAKLAAGGMKIEDILPRLEKMKSHIHTSFIVDTLDFLVRQKQISEVTGRLGKAFMIHPIISLKKGKMDVSRVFFGSREHAWERYIASVFDVPGEIDKEILFITYVGMTNKELEWVQQKAAQYAEFDNVYVQKASPAIAANCGPGTFGLLFFTKL
ncbi:MAG: DegV family EDD domain-containing protein [Lachnospiraceae bacterium]|nr:DegV family EDD domain-containing protein [Lachnospiraceae bacterium]